MTKIIGKSIYAILIMIFVFAIAGCSNGNDSFDSSSKAKLEENKSQEKTVDFSVEELKTEKGIERFKEYYEECKKDGTISTEATPEEIVVAYINTAELDAGINEINDKYIDDNGYIKSESVLDVLDEIYKYTQQLENEGKVSGVQYNYDDMNICIVTNDGFRYMYAPRIEGLMSGGGDLDVLALNNAENYEYDMTANIESITLNHINKAGEHIEDELDVNLYQYEDKSTLGINRIKTLIKNLDSKQRHVILWRGHGNVWDYASRENVPAQSTSATRESVFWVDTDGKLAVFMMYYDDLVEGNVIVSSGSYALAPGFFTKYMSSVEGGIFYTGACYSAADGGDMSNAILSKGFECYFGSTDSISVGYSDLMMLSVIENLCKYEDEFSRKPDASAVKEEYVSSERRTITAQKALRLSQEDKGTVDIRHNLRDVLLNLPEVLKVKVRNTQVVIRGNASARLIGSEELDLSFAWVEDIGNNPNNLWQSSDTLAFDDDYIYYASNENLYRVKYNGEDNEKIASKVEATLNVYDGYIYSSDCGTASNPYVKIKRINSETKAEEILFEMAGTKWREDYYVESMLAYDGYLFCTIIDEGNREKTYIYAIDLDDLSYYQIHYEPAARSTEFTVDDAGNLYAIMKTDGSNANLRKFLKVSMDDLRNNANDVSLEETLFMEEFVGETNLGNYANVILGSGGMLRNLSNSDSYGEYYYGKVDAQQKKWYASGNSYPELNSNDADADKHTIVTARNRRYYLDGSVVFFVTDVLYTKSNIIGDDQNNVPIYICSDMDFANPQKIGTIYGMNLFDNGGNLVGVHDGKVYAIEKKGTEINLVIIDQKGVVNRLTIS
ncbi:MAG: hypothetical protein IJO09_03240 [Oscillospiraceae bacterium]|nr:hypothetical protein [Oscillospiraceae bacterium]